MQMRQRNKKSVRFIAAACFFTAAIFILAFYRGVFGDRLQRVFNPAALHTSADFVKVLDVGQADSILIYSNGYLPSRAFSWLRCLKRSILRPFRDKASLVGILDR